MNGKPAGPADDRLAQDEFIRLGEAVYGRWGWQTRLAEELGIRDSTIRKYKAGRLPIPLKLLAFLREKHARLGRDQSGAATETFRGKIYRRGSQIVIDLGDAIDRARVPVATADVAVEVSGQTIVLRRG